MEHGGYDIYFFTISGRSGNPLLGGTSFTRTGETAAPEYTPPAWASRTTCTIEFRKNEAFPALSGAYWLPTQVQLGGVWGIRC